MTKHPMMDRLSEHCLYCGRLIMAGNQFKVCTYPACRKLAYQKDPAYRANRRQIEARSARKRKAERLEEDDDS
jgi:hypothetical protein